MGSWIMQIGTVSGFKILSLAGSNPAEPTKYNASVVKANWYSDWF